MYQPRDFRWGKSLCSTKKYTYTHSDDQYDWLDVEFHSISQIGKTRDWKAVARSHNADFEFSFDQQKWMSSQVIATDYETYSVTYSCSEKYGEDWGFIQTRGTTIQPQLFAELKQIL